MAVFLGERKEADPAGVFKLLQSFTEMFDHAFTEVLKRNLKDL